MDLNYWDNFYKNRKAVNYPSPFAEFCLKNFLIKNSIILELGSGNGRDAFYFSENKHTVFAVDQSTEVVSLDKEKINFSSNGRKLKFINSDFVTMDYNKFLGVNTIYSRFTMHSVDEKSELIVLEHAYNLLEPGGQFLIEARTTKDSLFGVGRKVADNSFFSDHFRRFIDSQVFIKKVMDVGYQITYFIESDSLSVYRDEDPFLMRVVLTK